MDQNIFPRGSEYRNQYIRGALLSSLATTLLIALYLTALLRLTPEQWKGFAAITGGLFVLLFVAQDRVNRRLWGPVVRCLDRIHEGRVGPEDLVQGFAAATNLPVRAGMIGWFWWILGGVLVGAGMKLRYETLTTFSALVMVAGATSGGFVSTVFHFFLVKRVTEPVRLALAEALPNPAQRQSLIRATSIKQKLRLSVTGVTVFTVMFAILCAHVRSTRPVEAHAARVQSLFLDELARRVAAGGEGVLEEAGDEARRLGIADAVGLVDPEFSSVIGGDLGSLMSEELRLMREVELDRGDSTGFDSPHVLSWQRLPGEGRVLVAILGWDPLMGELRGTRTIFAVLLVVSAGIALALAYLLAGDVSRATESLRSEVERLASGDLRRPGLRERGRARGAFALVRGDGTGVAIDGGPCGRGGGPCRGDGGGDGVGVDGRGVGDGGSGAGDSADGVVDGGDQRSGAGDCGLGAGAERVGGGVEQLDSGAGCRGRGAERDGGRLGRACGRGFDFDRADGALGEAGAAEHGDAGRSGGGDVDVDGGDGDVDAGGGHVGGGDGAFGSSGGGERGVWPAEDGADDRGDGRDPGGDGDGGGSDSFFGDAGVGDRGDRGRDR
jgi:hypothetical protein